MRQKMVCAFCHTPIRYPEELYYLVKNIPYHRHCWHKKEEQQKEHRGASIGAMGLMEKEFGDGG